MERIGSAPGWDPEALECPSCDDASAAHLAGFHEEPLRQPTRTPLCELADCPNRMEQYEHYHTVVYVVGRA